MVISSKGSIWQAHPLTDIRTSLQRLRLVYYSYSHPRSDQVSLGPVSRSTKKDHFSKVNLQETDQHQNIEMTVTLHNSVTTSVPGPATTAALKELNGVFDVRAAQLVVDYDKSFGNL